MNIFSGLCSILVCVALSGCVYPHKKIEPVYDIPNISKNIVTPALDANGYYRFVGIFFKGQLIDGRPHGKGLCIDRAAAVWADLIMPVSVSGWGACEFDMGRRIDAAHAKNVAEAIAETKADEKEEAAAQRRHDAEVAARRRASERANQAAQIAIISQVMQAQQGSPILQMQNKVREQFPLPTQKPTSPSTSINSNNINRKPSTETTVKTTTNAEQPTASLRLQASPNQTATPVQQKVNKPAPPTTFLRKRFADCSAEATRRSVDRMEKRIAAGEKFALPGGYDCYGQLGSERLNGESAQQQRICQSLKQSLFNTWGHRIVEDIGCGCGLATRDNEVVDCHYEVMTGPSNQEPSKEGGSASKR